LVVGEAVVASGGDHQLRQVCDGPSGSWFGECGDRLGDRVVGAVEVVVPVAVAEACGGHATATASCQGWVEVAGHTARVRVPHVLDR
jgi:hypothetical protein